MRGTARTVRVVVVGMSPIQHHPLNGEWGGGFEGRGADGGERPARNTAGRTVVRLIQEPLVAATSGAPCHEWALLYAIALNAIGHTSAQTSERPRAPPPLRG